MLTTKQWNQYQEQGLVAVPGLLGEDEVAVLRDTSEELAERYQALPELSGDDDNLVHFERERGGAVRSLFGMHRRIDAVRNLIRSPKLAGPLKQILGNDAYVFHSKVNFKEGFEGTVWLWHQDFGYWQHDGMNDRMASVLVMLDKTTIHGGCLLFIPGSHRWGVLDHHSDETTTSYKQWCLTNEASREHILDDRNFIAAVGEPGDVYFFDAKIVHGSGHNMSPRARRTLIFACAEINNRPRPVESPRPDWVVAQDFEPFTNKLAAVSS